MTNSERFNHSDHIASLVVEAASLYHGGERRAEWQVAVDYGEVPGMVPVTEYKVPSADPEYPLYIVRLLQPLAATSHEIIPISGAEPHTPVPASTQSFEYHVAVLKNYCRYRGVPFSEIKSGNLVIGCVLPKLGEPFMNSELLTAWNEGGRHLKSRPFKPESLADLQLTQKYVLEKVLRTDTILYPPRAAKILFHEQTRQLHLDFWPLLLPAEYFNPKTQNDTDFRNTSWDAWRIFWRAVYAYFKFQVPEHGNIVPDSIYSDATFAYFQRKADLSVFLRVLLTSPESIRPEIFNNFEGLQFSQENIILLTPNRVVAILETFPAIKDFVMEIISPWAKFVPESVLEYLQNWKAVSAQKTLFIMLNSSDPRKDQISKILREKFGATTVEALDAVLGRVTFLQIPFKPQVTDKFEATKAHVIRVCNDLDSHSLPET